MYQPVAQEAEIAKLAFQLKGAKCTGCAPGTGCWLNLDVDTLILWVKQNACNHQVLEGLAQMADTCRKMKVALNLARLHACQQRNLQRRPFFQGPLTGAMPDQASSCSASSVPDESPAAVAVMAATGRLPPSMLGGHSYNPLRKPNLGSDTGRAMPAAMAGEQRKRPLGEMHSMLNSGLGPTKPSSKGARYSSIFAPSLTDSVATPAPHVSASSASATSSTRQPSQAGTRKVPRAPKCSSCFSVVDVDSAEGCMCSANDCQRLYHLKCLRERGIKVPTLMTAMTWLCPLCCDPDKIDEEPMGDPRRLSRDFRATEEQDDMDQAIWASLADQEMKPVEKPETIDVVSSQESTSDDALQAAAATGGWDCPVLCD